VTPRRRDELNRCSGRAQRACLRRLARLHLLHHHLAIQAESERAERIAFRMCELQETNAYRLGCTDIRSADEEERGGCEGGEEAR
jgi:hypothetical protein